MLADRTFKLTSKTGYVQDVGVLQHLRRQQPASICGFVLGGQLP